MLRISVVIVTRNRSSLLEACLNNLRQQTLGPYETIVIDNASDDHTVAILAQKFPEVRLIKNSQNLGIAAGRNVGYRAAAGELCVTLDDDALFDNDDALEQVSHYFASDTNLCCLSFEVKDKRGRIIRNYIPRRDRKVIAADSPGASFVGTGHAMHRARFLYLGGFWEELGLYFGEEPDLSYRILEAGYGILHTKSIAVIHEAALARSNGRRIYYGARNTPWIAVKNLPWHCAASLTALAWGYYLVHALRHGLMASYLRGVADCMRGMSRVLKQRKPISKKTIGLLKRYSGVYCR